MFSFLPDDSQSTIDEEKALSINYLICHQSSSLGAASFDELEQVHHSLCLHPLHLSMCGNECPSPTHSITTNKQGHSILTLHSCMHLPLTCT